MKISVAYLAVLVYVFVSCTCADGSEWAHPCGGRENVVLCAPNEETSTIECTCDDGTVFEIQVLEDVVDVAVKWQLRRKW